MQYQRIFLIVAFILLLPGCLRDTKHLPPVSYLTNTSLDQPHHYGLSAGTLSSNKHGNDWWSQFHDRELNQLMAIAFTNSPTLQIAAMRVQKAASLSNIAYSELWPTVNFSGYVIRERFSTYGLAPPPFNGKTYNIGNVGLNFNYDFDLWGKNREQLAADQNREIAQEYDLLMTRLVLSSAIVTTYFQLQALNEKQLLTKILVEKYQEIYNIASVRQKRKIDSAIPLETVKTNMQVYQLQLDQLKQHAATLQHQLAVLMGQNPLTTTFEMKAYSDKTRTLHMPNQVSANVLAKRPDVLAALARAKAACHDVNVAHSRFFPNINLLAVTQFQSLGLGHLFDATSQNNYAGPAIDLPIFDAGNRHANFDAKRAQYNIAIDEYNQTVLTALQEIANQLSNINALNQAVDAQSISYQAATLKADLIDKQFHHEITNYVSVLTAKSIMLEEKLKKIDYESKRTDAYIGLIKALGGNIA